MRRTLYAIAALALIITAACNKEHEDINNVPDKGTIRFINKSADLYDFYLDDARFGNLYGDDTAIVNSVGTGSHRVKAIQAANIVGAPTLRELVVIVKKDSVVTFTFP